ncbi:hypothetical protein [Hungatella hathewayi]
MYKNENLENIQAIHRRCGEAQFRMAIQYLFDTGHQNFTEENVAESKKQIRRDTPENAIMTEGFQCELLDRCLELSRLPIWDILLYVKLYLCIQGDDLLLLEEAEQALRAWRDIMAPQSWKDACADPDLRIEILREMIRRHDAGYTKSEIREAVCHVAESQQEE